jgi:hypothetical protein
MRSIQKGMIVLSVVFLGACASNPPRERPSSTEPADTSSPGKTESANEKNLANAVNTPLSDLNLVKAPIPPILRAAQERAYRLPADHSCTSLAHEIEELDAVLGADIDTPATDKNPSADRARHRNRRQRGSGCRAPHR